MKSNIRQISTFSVLFAGLVIASVLTSCSGMSHPHDDISDLKNPENLLTFYVSCVSSLMLLLVLFADRGISRGLLDAVRYTGYLSIVAAPLYAVVVHNALYGVAMGISGVIAVWLTPFAFRGLYSPREVVASKNKTPTDAKKNIEIS